MFAGDVWVVRYHQTKALPCHFPGDLFGCGKTTLCQQGVEVRVAAGGNGQNEFQPLVIDGSMSFRVERAPPVALRTRQPREAAV
mgnify:CR=1 FL=1|jgi:hypothetical protein